MQTSGQHQWQWQWQWQRLQQQVDTLTLTRYDCCARELARLGLQSDLIIVTPVGTGAKFALAFSIGERAS